MGSGVGVNGDGCALPMGSWRYRLRVNSGLDLLRYSVQWLQASSYFRAEIDDSSGIHTLHLMLNRRLILRKTRNVAMSQDAKKPFAEEPAEIVSLYLSRKTS